MKKSQIATIAEEVFKLSQEYNELGKTLQKMKETLKAEGSGEYGDYVVIVTDADRESFSLKDARQNVTKAVWEKIKGFVKVTHYQTVKVVQKG